ncbi:MAG: glutamate formiminotransferase, partial [Defluviitaleaceae bacterium]|nr:glutamate formiminotransferase [Defluviitaleaceae bacterium]
VRGSSGGLAYCKALGMLLHDRNIAQVSMNLVDYEATPVHRVFEMVKREAARYGVQVVGSELVGLAPAKAFIDCAEYFLQLENFDAAQHVLDNRIH